MAKFKVVLTDNIFPDMTLETDMLKKLDAQYVLNKDETTLKEECRDADAVVNTYLQMTKDIINGMEKCKLVMRNGIGINTIDVDACTAKGIMVANLPRYCLDEVSTHAVALILALNRKITLLNDCVKSGVWDVKKAIPSYSLAGKTVGLVGFGKIPRLVHEKIKGFGVTTLAFDPFVSADEMEKLGAKKAEMDELLTTSDYISIHSPLTPETKGMFNETVYKKMKKSAYIINTARGPVINEADLIKALNDGEIAGAGLDVLMEDGVELSNPLLKMDNVIITPHAAWYSEESIVNRRMQTMESVISVLEGGEPDSLVNRKGLGR